MWGCVSWWGVVRGIFLFCVRVSAQVRGLEVGFFGFVGLVQGWGAGGVFWGVFWGAWGAFGGCCRGCCGVGHVWGSGGGRLFGVGGLRGTLEGLGGGGGSLSRGLLGCVLGGGGFGGFWEGGVRLGGVWSQSVFDGGRGMAFRVVFGGVSRGLLVWCFSGWWAWWEPEFGGRDGLVCWFGWRGVWCLGGGARRQPPDTMS